MTAPVLITGIGKRLGLALAWHFINRGQAVIGTYRTHYVSIDELAEAGVTLYHCDFYAQDQVAQLMTDIQHNHQQLRGIVHNASDWLPDNTELPHDQIMQRMMQVHVSVPYQLNLGLRALLERNDTNGSMTDIIHVTDFVGTTGSKKHIAYSASKAAMENMTLSFATLYAPGIKVNAIAPALMLFNPEDNDAYREKSRNKSLMKKEGGAQEFLDCIDFLFGSEYITGRSIPLDGGRHLKRP